MATEILENREVRKNHQWKGDTCIHCGAIKISVENPNASWNWTQYVDSETGEITRKMTCYSKQLELF